MKKTMSLLIALITVSYSAVSLAADKPILILEPGDYKSPVEKSQCHRHVENISPTSFSITLINGNDSIPCQDLGDTHIYVCKLISDSTVCGSVLVQYNNPYRIEIFHEKITLLSDGNFIAERIISEFKMQTYSTSRSDGAHYYINGIRVDVNDDYSFVWGTPVNTVLNRTIFQKYPQP